MPMKGYTSLALRARRSAGRDRVEGSGWREADGRKRTERRHRQADTDRRTQTEGASCIAASSFWAVVEIVQTIKLSGSRTVRITDSRDSR